MEIPPVSDFAQASAFFGDKHESSRLKEILGIWPNELPNKHLNSLDQHSAASVSNLDKEFKTDDYHEAYRIYNGPLNYPFQDTAQIFHHKFDPFYWDGSELDGDYNVQENLIGTPLGASTLEDPRMTYVSNMLQLKEMHTANDPLDNAYLQNLYMINSDKGANYYQNQLQKLNFAMAQHSRVSKEARHVPLHSIQFTKNMATGNPIHEKHTAKRKIDMPSEAGLQHSSRRQRRMNVLDANKLSSQVKSSVPSLRNFEANGGDSHPIGDYHMPDPEDNGNRTDSGSVTLVTDQSGYEHLVTDGTSVSSQGDLSFLATLGTPSSTVTPYTHTEDLASVKTIRTEVGGNEKLDQILASARKRNIITSQGAITVQSQSTAAMSGSEYDIIATPEGMPSNMTLSAERSDLQLSDLTPSSGMTNDSEIFRERVAKNMREVEALKERNRQRFPNLYNERGTELPSIWQPTSQKLSDTPDKSTSSKTTHISPYRPTTLSSVMESPASMAQSSPPVPVDFIAESLPRPRRVFTEKDRNEMAASIFEKYNVQNPGHKALRIKYRAGNQALRQKEVKAMAEGHPGPQLRFGMDKEPYSLFSRDNPF